MTKLLTLLAEATLGYGAIGLLALAGWVLAGWFLWRDYKKKEQISGIIAEKEKEIKEKDKQILEAKEELADTIAKISEDRINDLKEISDDYNKVANSTIHTLDKLTTALNVVKHIQ